MIKSSIVNVPEESWDPLTFLSQKNREHLINEKKRESKKVDVKLEEMSLDSDVSNPKQHIYIKTDCVNEASGSSYIELGNTKVLCSVYGPREIPRKDDYDFKVANVNCEFRFASFSCFMQRRGQLNKEREQGLDEKNFSAIIEEALKPSIFLHKYPKSQIDLYILCIQNDIDSKNILSASIIAASMAMVNASIELYDLVSSYTYIPINLTVSFMPSLHQVTSIYFSNELNNACLSVDLFKSHIKESIENCKKVHSYMKSVLVKNMKEEEKENKANTRKDIKIES